MLKISYYDHVENEKFKFAVILAKTQGKWVFCKHKERDTWEMPAGHREENENILETAKRELKEETGAVEFEIQPVCAYSVADTTDRGGSAGEETFGMLFFADIKTFETELHYEIEKIMITDELPQKWTYPLIQPMLFAKALELGFR